MGSEEAIVLAGGFGTRLRSVVSDVPKPLAPVAGRPFLAWVLDQLAEGGMRRVILAVGYRSGQIREAIGDRWAGMSVVYSNEDRPLGTGGAVRNAAGHLSGQGVHVINGDTFLRYRPAELEHFTRSSSSTMGIALAHVDDVARYGAVSMVGDKVAGFREKGEHGPGWINAGCYYFSAAALAGLPDDDAFSLESTVLSCLAPRGEIAGFTATAGFIDIGIPEDYQRAQTLFGGRAP